MFRTELKYELVKFGVVCSFDLLRLGDWTIGDGSLNSTLCLLAVLIGLEWTLGCLDVASRKGLFESRPGFGIVELEEELEVRSLVFAFL